MQRSYFSLTTLLRKMLNAANCERSYLWCNRIVFFRLNKIRSFSSCLTYQLILLIHITNLLYKPVFMLVISDT